MCKFISLPNVIMSLTTSHFTYDCCHTQLKSDENFYKIQPSGRSLQSFPHVMTAKLYIIVFILIEMMMTAKQDFHWIWILNEISLVWCTQSRLPIGMVLILCPQPLSTCSEVWARVSEVLAPFMLTLFRTDSDLPNYCQTSNIRHTKSLNSIVSHLILQLFLPSPLKSGVKTRMKM